MIPRPMKGNAGETSGKCKHCDAERVMNNVERARGWNTGRLS